MMLFYALSTSAHVAIVSDNDTVQTPFFKHVKPRTNLIYWLTATPNIGTEVPIGNAHWSIGANLGYNGWKYMPYGHHAKLRHVLAAIELRHWAKPEALRPSSYETLEQRSFFWGINAFYSHFNIGRIDLPLGIYESLRHQYKQGDLAAIGAFIGHSWRLNRIFRLEAEAGLGWGYANYKRHDCDGCYRGDGKKGFLVPKLAVNLVLDPVRRPAPPVVTPVMPVDTIFEPIFELVALTTLADTLAIDHPIVESYDNYRPYDRTRILRKEKGMLYVHFPLDKADLLRDFRDNARVLDEIVSLTRQIVSDPRCDVRTIQIIGLASIEGPAARNQQLSDGRAQALRNYVMEHVPGINESQFEVVGGGEAWTEFRDQVNDLLADSTTTALTHNELAEVLRIIDTEPSDDQRESRLRRYQGGRVYTQLKVLLADQRNSGYIRIYFDRVPDRQAEIINQGSDQLRHERYQEALSLLLTVKEDPRAWNALATALYMTGHRVEALDYFRRAADRGDADAHENLRRLNNTEMSKYRNIETTK